MTERRTMGFVLAEMEEQTGLGIKYCPFCLSRLVDLGSNEPDTGEYRFYVTCQSCSAGGPFEKSAHDAVNSWNTRFTVRTMEDSYMPMREP